jgi:hypothetical protein
MSCVARTSIVVQRNDVSRVQATVPSTGVAVDGDVLVVATTIANCAAHYQALRHNK